MRQGIHASFKFREVPSLVPRPLLRDTSGDEARKYLDRIT